MAAMFVLWIVSALVIVLLAVLLGNLIRKEPFGILIDSRGRYSLTQLQLIAWSVVVISLISGVFFGRVFANVPGALDFTIPDEVLLLMGISVGSAVTATVVKAGKDATRPAAIAASNAQDRPRFTQIFLVEEGELADQVVDVAKFQAFWITVVLVAAYVVLAVAAIKAATSPAEMTALPKVAGTFVTLLGISHAGYLAGKIPDRPGIPAGLTVHLRRLNARPGGAAVVAPPIGLNYAPRNP
jgi:hypothetical protein